VTSDHDAITALIYEYAYRLDAGDLEGVAALFEHAELGSTRHDRRKRGSVEARTTYDNVIIYPDGTPQTQHQITNVIVHVTGGRATARSCFTVLQVTGQGLHPVLAGEYHDQFERVDGAWRFTERIFDPRLFGEMSGHMKPGEQ
jgi:3-phenylpropionate/cinnamic acid dioxygenase small subunit